MPLIEPISDHRIAVEDLPAPTVINALSINGVYMIYRTAASSKIYCYIKITSKTPITLPGESDPYDCNIMGPAVYIETTNSGEIKTGEIGIRTISNLLSNKTHLASDNWLIYTSDTTEYNSMVDLVVNSVCMRGYDELVFYCDCNNNTIDRVSGLRMFEDVHGGATVYTPSFVADPADPTRYCIRKPNGVPGMSTGTGVVPVIIGDYTARPDVTGRYVIANSSGSGAISDETNRLWLASPIYGNHKVEFYWYCSSTSPGTGACIFDAHGLGNNNTNADRAGISLIQVGSNIIIRAQNNNTTNYDTAIGSRASLAGNWYRFEFYFFYISSTQYKATANVYDVNGTLLATTTRTMTLPLYCYKGERGCFTFLSDYFSNGQWARDIYDYIKEVKVYQLDYPN